MSQKIEFNLGNLSEKPSEEVQRVIDETSQEEEDQLSDYLTTGLGAAAISAGVGTYNTGVALAESLGAVDSYEESAADEGEVIGDVMGEDARAFYDRHKVGIDMTGFALGMMVPGSLAVKGVRAIQLSSASGRLTQAQRLATGLDNPDLVLGSKAVQAAREKVLSNAAKYETDIQDATILRAYGAGAKQAVIDAVAFDVAAGLTMAKNDSLNSENLSYWESVGHFLKESVNSGSALGFLGLGIGIDTGVEILRIRGYLEKSYKAAEVKNNFRNVVLPQGIAGAADGDQLDFVMRQWKNFRTNPLYRVAPDDTFGASRNALAEEQFKEIASSIWERLGKQNPDTAKFFEKIIKSPETYGDDMTDIFSNGIAVRNVSQKEMMDSIDQFNKTAAVNRVILLSHADVSGNYQQFRDEMKSYLDLAGLNGENILKAFEGTPGAADELAASLDANAGLQMSRENWDTIAEAAQNGVLSRQKYGRNVAQYFAGAVMVSQGKLNLYLTDFITLNNARIREGLLATNQYESLWKEFNEYREMLGMPKVTMKSYKNSVLAHELGHAKNNTPMLRQIFIDSMKAMDTDPSSMELMAEIFALSMARRPVYWGPGLMGQFMSVAAKEDFADAARYRKVMEDLLRQVKLAVDNNDPTFFTEGIKKLSKQGVIDPVTEGMHDMANIASYLLDTVRTNPNELLADAASMFSRPESAELAKKMAPNVAELFDSYGSIQKTWSPTHIYFNQRTGKTSQSWIPGLRDMYSEVSVVEPAKKAGTKYASLRAGGKTYDYDPSKFKFMDIIEKNDLFWNVMAAAGDDFYQYDAMWSMAQKEDLAKFLIEQTDGRKLLEFTEWDLPHIERWVTRTKLDGMEPDAVDRIRITLDDKSVVEYDRESLKEFLEDRKLSLRNELSLGGKFNENQMAKMLNLDVDVAVYGDKKVGDILLMDKKNFDEPEVFSVDYNPVDMNKLTEKSRSFESTQFRLNLIRQQREKASAATLAEDYNLFQEVQLTPADLAGMSSTMDRQGMFMSGRSEFATVEEKFFYLGTLTRKVKNARLQDLTDEIGNFYGIFNRSDAAGKRAELAIATNHMRRERYYLLKNPNPQSSGPKFVMITREKIREIENELTEEISSLDDLFDEALSHVNPSDTTAFSLSDDVGRFLEWHRNRNAADLDKKILQGKARGANPVYDKMELYPPPKDLKTTPYFLFVVPTEFMRGADPRKFMIYAQTPEELAAKRAAIESRHGTNYKILSQDQVNQDKKLLGEYDSGMVFNEIEFDASLTRTGTAAEIAPNMDLTLSNTLELYNKFHHNQTNHLINGAVELQFADVVENLKSIDSVFTRDEQATLFKRKTEDSVYEYLRKTMLDDFGEGGAGEQLWARVNDYIGEHGSKVLNTVFSKFRASAAGFTQEQLDNINLELERNGFNPPFRNAMEAIAASPDLEVRGTLPRLVRTMNNFSSTFQIRLDGANWIVQTMSTPILTSGVLKEAQAALRGTKAGGKLDALTSTTVPGTNVREPTAAILMGNATAAFFTPKGRKFIDDLKNRGIINDYLQHYLDAMDFSELNGSHTMSKVNNWINRVGNLGGNWSPFKHTEEFSRFIAAHTAYQILSVRGVKEADMWPTIASFVEKVHGQYRTAQRPTLFRGVVGQSIGLYQTYVLNFLQNATRWVKDGNKRALAITAGLQGTIFGLQSFPGFQTLNGQIAAANNYREDLYSLTNTDRQSENSSSIDGWGHYFLYGAGSHMFGTPIDFATRGDMTLRNALVFPNPMSFESYPAANLLVKAYNNTINSASMVSKDDPLTFRTAFVHGLAHNGFSRPLQGLGQIFANEITNKEGKPYFQNSNYVDYNMMEEFNYASAFSRMLGTKPLNETILMSSMFRRKAYEAESKEKIAAMGGDIQARLDTGVPLSESDYTRFMNRYMNSGGNLENFNTYMTKQLAMTSTTEVAKFQQKIRNPNTIMGRTYRTMRADRDTNPPWQQELEDMQPEQPPQLDLTAPEFQQQM